MNAAKPAWAETVQESDDWSFDSGKLLHKDFEASASQFENTSLIQDFVVKKIYAAQKTSRIVNETVDALLRSLGPNDWGLNVGAGKDSVHPNVVNLDIAAAPHIDVVNSGCKLPFKDNSLDLVISQEVLEHVTEPRQYIAEIHRVLKPGSLFYCQLPFTIGYHPGPNDYWRFTKEAYGVLFAAPRWNILELEQSLGHGSGFYRILVEFIAVNADIISPKLYKPSKGLAAILFSPLKLLDKLTKYSQQKDRIPGGYFCIAKKTL